MSRISKILTVLAIATFANFSTADLQKSPSMKLSLIASPAESSLNLLPGEPLEACLVVQPPKEGARCPDFILHVGSIVVPDSMLLMGPMRSKEGLPASENIEFTVPVFFMGQSLKEGNTIAYLLTKPGQYAIWVENRINGDATAKIMVTVREFPSDEIRKSYEAYEKLKEVVPLIYFEKNPGTTGENLDQFLETYGTSPYAPIVRLAKGIQEITALKELRVVNREEFEKRRRNLADIQSYFEQALAAPNSFVQQRAQYFLALTKVWAKDYEAAHKLLTDLVSSFPSGAKSEDAKKLLKELDDHRSEWGKP